MQDAGYSVVIQMDSVKCALKLKDVADYSKACEIYSEFLSEGPADITIDLEVTNQLDPADLDKVVSETIYTHEGGRFWSSSQIVNGQYDLDKHFIGITADRSLGNPDLEFNHLNRMITIAYYSACKMKYNGNPPAMLVHGSGIVHNGKAIVFAGPSESGKTTIARLYGEKYGTVINDEMVLISRPKPGEKDVIVQGAPIFGGLHNHHNVKVPLRCILLLKQSDRTFINDLDKTDVYLRFIRQVINPAHIGQRSRRDIYALMADFSSDIVGCVPVFELEFNLDVQALKQAITELEERLDEDE